MSWSVERAANAVMRRWNVHVKNESGRDDNVEVEAASELEAERRAAAEGHVSVVIGAYPADDFTTPAHSTGDNALGAKLSAAEREEEWHLRELGALNDRGAGMVRSYGTDGRLHEIGDRVGPRGEVLKPGEAGYEEAGGRPSYAQEAGGETGRDAGDTGDEVRTYHQVTTLDGNKVITRAGADYAIANYGLNGAVREVQGYETPRGFAYADSTVGADIRREGGAQPAAEGDSFWWGGYLFDARTGEALPFSENDERGRVNDEQVGRDAGAVGGHLAVERESDGGIANAYACDCGGSHNHDTAPLLAGAGEDTSAVGEETGRDAGDADCAAACAAAGAAIAVVGEDAQDAGHEDSDESVDVDQDEQALDDVAVDAR